ncbi:DUF2798 domain-containing protein [Paludibacterium purpuratum]|uniref:Uncharacterized protein DUF2798 n=1 Tax=Paludibacterium purpuratum TaxID=1144873 RepID=A0A4R7B6A7_9NEIS|nr:DUF2798 domain-containing protein [Paludibacterium purpuratum]TDR80210.1 uncharacterized protein DUF2798 [Paludibacterium purpuratum]
MSPSLRYRLTFGFLMSAIMSVLMCGWITWLNLGLRPDFLARWLHAFLRAWPAAFVAVVLLAPWVQQATQHLLRINLASTRKSS